MTTRHTGACWPVVALLAKGITNSEPSTSSKQCQGLFEHEDENADITHCVEVYLPARSAQSFPEPKTVTFEQEICLSDKLLTHETANAMHEDVLKPDTAILEKSERSIESDLLLFVNGILHFKRRSQTSTANT